MKTQRERRAQQASDAAVKILKALDEESVSVPRSSPCPRYQDLNYSFVTRTAEAMTEGYHKHEKAQNLQPHEKNYMLMRHKEGLERVSHLLKHVHALNFWYHFLIQQESETTPGMAAYELPPDFELEDHLGHAAANLNMLAGLEDAGKMPKTWYKAE